jgi:antitoxin component of MazEF toxin-antitoxin module
VESDHPTIRVIRLGTSTAIVIRKDLAKIMQIRVGDVLDVVEIARGTLKLSRRDIETQTLRYNVQPKKEKP